MGPMDGAMRLAVFHMNVPSMIGQITSIVSSAGVNIENMTDKSRGDYAYCLLDLGSELDDDAVAKLSSIDGIYRVRTIHK